MTDHHGYRAIINKPPTSADLFLAHNMRGAHLDFFFFFAQWEGTAQESLNFENGEQKFNYCPTLLVPSLTPGSTQLHA